MADALTLKVSENEYRDALTKLNSYSDGLKNELQKLQDQRGKLESCFASKVISTPLREMIQNKEKQVQGSIDSIQVQIKQIENYLQTMSTAETNISGVLKEAAQTNVEAFM